MEKTTTLSAALSESSTLLSSGAPIQRKGKKKKQTSANLSASSIHYRGVNIYQAASQGSLPVCVLLWGMASAKRVNLVAPDSQGNNPLHMAALADTPEVVNFLLQQTRGYFSEDVRMVDTRNHAGETPLMRVMTTGNFAVAKALIDEGSDPLATDSQGNSMFTLLAKSGQIWCLNSMYHTICNMHGTQVALELMCTLDNEAHSALDWAADFGDVNVLEFFIRKGLNPFRVDGMGRTALYWAVKSNRLEAARFLMMVGCDPLQKDYKEQTPLQLAQRSGFQEVYRLLSAGRSAYRRELPENIVNSIHCIDPSSTPRLYTLISSEKRSHCIYLHNRSCGQMAAGYGLFFFVLWIAAAFLPFYAWFVLCGLIVYFYRRFRLPETPMQQSHYLYFLAKLNNFLCADEKGVGFWLGSMALYLVYLFSCFITRNDDSAVSSYSSFEDWTYGNPLQISAIDAAAKDRVLFWINVAFTAMAILSWGKFMVFDTDPGIINTRESDFEEVLAQSLPTNGPPPSGQYCRTTFVKKPLRSKYCKKIGCVVARMDHYCIWLNLTIGFKNHRAFLLLLLCNFLAVATAAVLIIRCLARELHQGNACTTVETLLSRDFFMVTLLAAITTLAALGTGALLYVQTGNILSNITVNERINRERYTYLNDNEGNPRNRFDRGALSNVLEFLRFPGFDIDYTTMFELPPELTQENMRLNEKRHGSGRYLVNSHGLNALFGTQSVSGTPSLDLEMANRHRAESTDSGDTFSAEVVV